MLGKKVQDTCSQSSQSPCTSNLSSSGYMTRKRRFNELEQTSRLFIHIIIPNQGDHRIINITFNFTRIWRTLQPWTSPHSLPAQRHSWIFRNIVHRIEHYGPVYLTMSPPPSFLYPLPGYKIYLDNTFERLPTQTLGESPSTKRNTPRTAATSNNSTTHQTAPFLVQPSFPLSVLTLFSCQQNNHEYFAPSICSFIFDDFLHLGFVQVSCYGYAARLIT